MINYTMDCYETKREILNFSQKVSKGLNKKVMKFVGDMQYGLSKSKSCLIDLFGKLKSNLTNKYNILFTTKISTGFNDFLHILG